MGFSGKYIIYGVDGTGSHEWRNSKGTNSHIWEFVNESKALGGFKKYEDGPGKLKGGVIFGRGTGPKISYGVLWISMMTKMLSDFRDLKVNRRFIDLPSSEKNSLKEYMRDRLRIVIVGHSRGGLAAINIASKLPLPVYFMGLYDAVDMHASLDCGIIDNVDYTYHAMRHPIMHSRSSWGNCGDGIWDKMSENQLKPVDTMKAYTGIYEIKYFKTSHGGIGGDPVIMPSKNQDAWSDMSCRNDTIKGGVYKLMGDDLGLLCQIESNAANFWIRQKARDKGIKF